MNIDDESFDPTHQHPKSCIVPSHSLSSNSGMVSVKSVNELLVNDDEYFQECYTDEECYLYGELYENDSGVSCAINKPDTHPDEVSLMEDMSIDDERQECKPLRTESPTYSYCSFLEIEYQPHKADRRHY